MAAKRSSRGSAAKIRVYIQDDNHDKENIEDQDHIDKISSEERVNSQELEETPQKGSVSLNVHHDLILCQIDEYEARPCHWDARLRPVNYHELIWPFDHVNDSW